MSDKKPEDIFETTEDIDEDIKIKNNVGEQTVLYTLLLVCTGINFVIGATLVGLLVNGTLCLFDTMNVLTSDLTGFSGDDDIQQMAKDQYMGCLAQSVFTPITVLTSLIGGLLTGYPTYKFFKKIIDGRKMKTML